MPKSDYMASQPAAELDDELQQRLEPSNHQVTVDWSSPTDEIGAKPDPLARKVLDDFEKNGPITMTVEKRQDNVQIKVPR